jgi:hypothetical protein
MQPAHWNLEPQHLNTRPGVITAGSGASRKFATASAIVSSVRTLHWQTIISVKCPSGVSQNTAFLAGCDGIDHIACDGIEEQAFLQKGCGKVA